MTYFIYAIALLLTLGMTVGALTLITISIDYLKNRENMIAAITTATVGIAALAITAAAVFYFADTTATKANHCRTGTVFVEGKDEWWCEPQ